MIDELIRFACRTGLLMVLGVPLLLPVGWGVGKLTARVLALPDPAAVRSHIPETSRSELQALSRYMDTMLHSGERTRDYYTVYREHVAPVERVLQRYGVQDTLARRIAWPLVMHAYRTGLEPATVLAVLLVESSGKPQATSPVGARGLMQVMPLHAGRWKGCGRDLYDIENNLCYGTSILAWYLRRHRGDERQALLGYNGCVRGTNTPNCWQYPDKVRRIRRVVRSILTPRPRPVPAAAAP